MRQSVRHDLIPGPAATTTIRKGRTMNTSTTPDTPATSPAATTPAPPQADKTTARWTNLGPKDWISVGVYAAVYFILVYASA
jgi:hypothetical protein